MVNVDRFESIFKSADKAVFAYERKRFERLLLVTDLPETEAVAFADTVRDFLSVLETDTVLWRHVGGQKYQQIKELLGLVEQARPDLIVTYRHLKTEGWSWAHGLGEYLEVLIHEAHVPILILPHPDAHHALPHTVRNTDRVMAVTNHLTGDDRLVNLAVRMTNPQGVCWLSHIEPQDVFDRYMQAIEKIPDLDTDTAASQLQEKLLGEPRDYIESCRRVLQENKINLEVRAEVRMGRQLADYRQLIESRRVDLLILESTDAQQLAWNPAAYPLVVELREIPLLLI